MECRGFVFVNKFLVVVGELGGRHARGSLFCRLLEPQMFIHEKLDTKHKAKFVPSAEALPYCASAVVGLSLMIQRVIRWVAVFYDVNLLRQTLRMHLQILGAV